VQSFSVNARSTITSFSTDCQQSMSGRFSPLPGPFHRFLLRPLHPIFGPLRSRCAHMLCMRASHDEYSAKTK